MNFITNIAAIDNYSLLTIALMIFIKMKDLEFTFIVYTVEISFKVRKCCC
jgi:hypothetical protein